MIEQEARGHLERIRGLVAAANRYRGNTPDAAAASLSALDAIRNDPLHVEVRSGWYALGWKAATRPAEYRIVVGEGVRIVGSLDSEGVPVDAEMWASHGDSPFREWHYYDNDEALLTYARQVMEGGR